MGHDIARVKALLRQEMRAVLEELTPQERAWSDGELARQFLSHPKVAQAQTILAYWGVGTEVDTRPILEALLAQGKRVCLPRCLPEHQMEARAVADLSQAEPDRYGIPAPGTDCPVVPREEIDLVLVPGLCFDSRGNRLGQGGGYYDRYLEEYDGLSMGLCREDFFQVNLPREPLDVWVRFVLTEEGQVWPPLPED